MKHERRQKIEEKVGFEIPRTEVHRQLLARKSNFGHFIRISTDFHNFDDDN